MCRIISIAFFLLFVCKHALGKDDKEFKLTPLFVDGYGTSIRPEIRFKMGKEILYVGLHYLVNPPYKARYYDAVYANKQYANNISQRFTVALGYEHSFRFKKDKIRIYPFLEFGCGYTGIKTEAYSPVSQLENGYMVVVYNYSFKEDKAFWIINRTGIGCEMRITPKIGFTQQIGLCPAFIKSNWRYNRYKWDFEPGIITPHYGIGVTYEL